MYLKVLSDPWRRGTKFSPRGTKFRSSPLAFEELVHQAQIESAENLPIRNADGGGNEQPANEALSPEDLVVHASKRVRR